MIKRILASLAVCALALSCAGEEGRGVDAVDPNRDIPFESYAEELFAQLRHEPLDSSLETEVGLFGDMSVAAGEYVVMGRYRLRVDSQATGSVGYMAFQIRDARRNYEPIPIVLEFISESGNWRLEDAQAHSRALESTPVGTPGTTESEPEAANGRRVPRPDSLEKSVGAHLEDWTLTAVEQLESP